MQYSSNECSQVVFHFQTFKTVDKNIHQDTRNRTKSWRWMRYCCNKPLQPEAFRMAFRYIENKTNSDLCSLSDHDLSAPLPYAIFDARFTPLFQYRHHITGGEKLPRSLFVSQFSKLSHHQQIALQPRPSQCISHLLLIKHAWPTAQETHQCPFQPDDHQYWHRLGNTVHPNLMKWCQNGKTSFPKPMIVKGVFVSLQSLPHPAPWASMTTRPKNSRPVGILGKNERPWENKEATTGGSNSPPVKL